MLLTPLREIITTARTQHPNNFEIEVRYGTFITSKSSLENPRFQPGVSIQTFSRLQTNLFQIAPVTITKSRDEIQGNICRTIFDDGREIWINKPRPVIKRDIPEYGLRVTGTQEITIEAPKNFKTSYFREKTRYSYPLAGGAVRVDLTRSTTDGRVTYEVELELLQGQAFDAFSRAAELILKLIQDTAILYTENDKKEVTVYFNNLLAGHNSDNYLDRGVLKQARNIKMRDMVWGGLIGNEKTGYKVNHKPDGTRRLLVFAPNGIWLLHPPHEYTRLTAEYFASMTGTVLDGELIPKEKRKAQAPTKPYWYLVIDTLAWQGDLASQKQPHSDRMKLAQIVVDRLESPLLAVNTMRFRSFNTPRKFFEVMRDMFQEQAILSYSQDGFIFTPESAEYNPKYPYPGKNGKERIISIDQFPLRERTLVNYADNLKWKEPTNLTIDFLIRKTQRGVELYSLQDHENVLFTGSLEHTFPGFIPEIPPILADVPDGSIVEFRWEGGTFVPVVIRSNKVKPDRLEIAVDVWEDIHTPISRELLEGKTFDLIEYYFTRIRRGLLFTHSNQEILLVLDAGHSKDFSRWWNYRHIIAHESNPDLRNSLKKRLISRQLDHKVTLVSSFDEIKEGVNVIALMYDVGRYWQSRDRLESLAQLIKRILLPQGRLVFFILDGDAVQEMFHPAYTPKFDIKGLDLGSNLLTYQQDQNILVTNYKGTRIEDKQETPVFIYDLIVKLSELQISEIHHGDSEDFLSLPEKMLSRLHTFGLVEAKGNEIQEGTEPLETTGSGKPSTKVEGKSEVVTSPKPVGSPALQVTPTTVSPRKTRDPSTSQKASPPSKKALPTRKKGRSVLPPRSVERPLRTLPVSAPRLRHQPGIGDDVTERLTVTWTNEPVFRIASIGDGSCFFHAYLKGFYAPYQNNNSYAFRRDLVRNFRNELATLITEKDPDFPGKIYYETVAKGAWVRMAEQQRLLKEPLHDDYGEPLDYSLKGMVQLLMSSRDIGDEMYSFVNEIIGIGIYVVRGTNKNIYPQTSVGNEYPSVVILGNGEHYEVVAVQREGGLQTLFDPDDPFIRQLRSLSTGGGRTTATRAQSTAQK